MQNKVIGTQYAITIIEIENMLRDDHDLKKCDEKTEMICTALSSSSQVPLGSCSSIDREGNVSTCFALISAFVHSRRRFVSA